MAGPRKAPQPRAQPRTGAPAPTARDRALSTAQAAVHREIAAQCIAKGMTQARAAQEAGVTDRTVAGYCAQQGFRDRVAALRAAAFEELEADIWANVRLALDIERRVFNGEVAADDPTWAEAKPHLNAVRGLLLRTAAADPPAGPPGVNFFIAPGGVEHERSERAIEATTTGQGRARVDGD